MLFYFPNGYCFHPIKVGFFCEAYTLETLKSIFIKIGEGNMRYVSTYVRKKIRQRFIIAFT